METLNRAWLRNNRGEGETGEEPPVRILQFGEGNFLRAFADWIFARLNASGLFSGSVRVLQPIRRGMLEELRKQDGVYTLLMRGSENGAPREVREIVSVVRDCLNPYEEWDRFLASACEPDLEYVVSNTTESGIVYIETPQPDGSAPDSFPAKVTAMLIARHDDPGAASGLTFLPCELIEKNGQALRDIVLRHLGDWDRPDVAKWTKEYCRFYNTLVDRIVTGYPGAEAEKICRELGYRDALLVAGEIFHFWAIEGDPELGRELPFDKADLDVVVTGDITPYRDRKVRVLNGAHTGNVLAAFLAGLDTVGEMMSDPLFGVSAEAMVFDEILPGVALPDAEKRRYAEATLERFRNPFVRHELAAISLNSVSKWSVRVLPSLKDYVAERNCLPPRLVFSLAALLTFYHGKRNGAGEYEGRRESGPYIIRDAPEVVESISSAWERANGDPAALAGTLLSDEKLWGENLRLVPGLAEETARQLAAIREKGVRRALADL